MDLLHVPYTGGGPSLAELLAGRIQLQLDNIPGAIAAVREGRVRGMAVTGTQRSPALPEVPAMAEYFPGFEISSWTAVCGPASLPPPLVERVSLVSRRILEDPGLVRAHEELGAEAWWMSSPEVTAYRAREEARLAPLIRASGARVE